jgi:hypothetical protein
MSVGSDGPKISESKIPTLKPNSLSVHARLIATVLLPTPPLQLETAIIFLMLLRLPLRVSPLPSSYFDAKLILISL